MNDAVVVCDWIGFPGDLTELSPRLLFRHIAFDVQESSSNVLEM
jgi:hypothetical protein